MTRAPAPAEFVNHSWLRARGWSPAMVRQLLGAPDALVANPRNPTWAPMRLWERERALAAEESLRVAAQRLRDG